MNTTAGATSKRAMLGAFQTHFERLLSGESVPMPDGKRARPTSKPRKCPTCAGTGRVTEEMPAACNFQYLDAPCGQCWEQGKIVDFVIEDDPMVLGTWSRSKLHTRAGELVAEIRSNADGVRVSIAPGSEGGSQVIISANRPGKTGYDIVFSRLIAFRLADAELAALGYRKG